MPELVTIKPARGNVQRLAYYWIDGTAFHYCKTGGSTIYFLNLDGPFPPRALVTGIA